MYYRSRIKCLLFVPKTQTPRVSSKSPHTILKKKKIWGTFLFLIFSIGKSYCSAWLSIEVLNFDFLIPISIFPVLKKVQCCCTNSLLEILHTTHCSVLMTSEECAAVDADRQFGIGMFCCMRVPFSLFQPPNSHLRYSTAIASRRNPSSRWRRHHFMPTLWSTLRAQLLVKETALLRGRLSGVVNCRQM